MHFRGAIFDLDGVITRTAGLHEGAWKRTFDSWLEERGEPFTPFTPTDYRELVDGKPRLDGIRSFLAARGIPADPAVVDLLARRKNELFRRLLDELGPEVYASSVALVETLRARGIHTAIATSSKNGRVVLGVAKIEGLFEAVVDGLVSEELGLEGKPAPDIFVEAARRIGVRPAEALLFEDAIAGVEAGCRGGFGLVIGVDRGAGHERLRCAGSDLVVSDLDQLSLPQLDAWFTEPRLPSALCDWSSIAEELHGRHPVFFLDYDGTLAPIVRSPELAVLPEGTRETLSRIAAPVVIVSGRALKDVQAIAGLEGITYAGSHGFDIAGPGVHRQVAPELRREIDAAAAELQAALSGVRGALVENKGFSVAVHYRNVAEAQVRRVETRVDEILARHRGLRKTGGKKVFELRPDVDWDKGRAILWILEALELDRPDVLPIHLGDDVTDEDAFRALEGRGIGILVADAPRSTAAHYALQDPEEVALFLRRFASAELSASPPP